MVVKASPNNRTVSERLTKHKSQINHTDANKSETETGATLTRHSEQAPHDISVPGIDTSADVSTRLHEVGVNDTNGRNGSWNPLRGAGCSHDRLYHTAQHDAVAIRPRVKMTKQDTTT